MYKITPEQTEEYIYLFGKHFAKEILKKGEKATTRLYYQTDNLGSTIGITDKDGNKLWDNDYKPFGESTNESGLIEELGTYTGKEIDPETGLYYFNARWYDPTLGRFITEDPIKDGNNWYIYCNNNPLTYTDPTGLIITAEGMAMAGYSEDGSYDASKDQYKDSYDNYMKEHGKNKSGSGTGKTAAEKEAAAVGCLIKSIKLSEDISTIGEFLES